MVNRVFARSMNLLLEGKVKEWAGVLCTVSFSSVWNSIANVSNTHFAKQAGAPTLSYQTKKTFRNKKDDLFCFMFHLYVCVWCMCVIYMCKIQIYNIYAWHVCLYVTVAMHVEVSGQHWMLALAYYPVCLLLHMPGKPTRETPEGLLSLLAILPV